MRQVFNIAVCFCLFFFFSCTFNRAQKSVKNIDKKEFEVFLNQIVEEEKIPGAIAAVFDSKGQILIQSAGVRHVDSVQRILNTDKFHIGSCTKSMTSTLTQILVAKGQLNWDTTIKDVFQDSINSIHPNYHDISIHELVTHRSGIAPNAFDYGIYPELDTINRRLKIFLENTKTPPPFDRGTFNYSNLGYLMAGCMLERITGQTWESLMKENLFVPLEMKSAGFGVPSTSGMVDQPWGHDYYVGEEKVDTIQPKQLDNPMPLGPAGTVYCNFEDWSKYGSLFLAKNDIVKEKGGKFLVDPVEDYACGWFVDYRFWAKGLTYSHSGSNTMWYTSIWLAPKIDRGFIVGINYGGENDGAICNRITEKLIALSKIE
ncbi:serine hydrolase domain-containing protein [Reichenbachiella versicolor]|uniref:serine hydrolase domain-containing protein n=1 Tax=Reichenbachiella versicolor TaxID=1821036 RepID=UPI000D6E074E|nr:serine hydrolase domain-containing protein [Reichenbachiella versicolor]